MYSETIALYETSQVIVWLLRLTNHIKQRYIGLLESPTIIYGDNDACVAQIHTGYIKSSITKHIAPKKSLPHELQKNEKLIFYKYNLHFTKLLSTSSFQKNIQDIDTRRI
jgi:hypothetical protein